MNEDLKQQVIDYSLKLNSTNLSPLRSGNLSVRAQIDDEEGFYITPSGIKYENLKLTDIVFLSLNKEYDYLRIANSGLNPSREATIKRRLRSKGLSLRKSSNAKSCERILHAMIDSKPFLVEYLKLLWRVGSQQEELLPFQDQHL